MKELIELLAVCVLSVVAITTPLDKNKIINKIIITTSINDSTNNSNNIIINTDSLVADSKSKTFKILNMQP